MASLASRSALLLHNISHTIAVTASIGFSPRRGLQDELTF